MHQKDFKHLLPLFYYGARNNQESDRPKSGSWENRLGLEEKKMKLRLMNVIIAVVVISTLGWIGYELSRIAHSMNILACHTLQEDLGRAIDSLNRLHDLEPALPDTTYESPPDGDKVKVEFHKTISAQMLDWEGGETNGLSNGGSDNP